MGTDETKINEWGKFAFDHFISLYNSQDAAKVGVKLVTSYNLREASETVGIPSWKDIVINF